jgi:hypothetical protein
MDHAVDGQILNRNKTKVVNDFPGCLMSEVVSTKPYTFINPSDNLSVFMSLVSTFDCFAQFSVRFGQGLFFFPEEPGIINGSSIGEHGESMQPHINSHGGVGNWKMLRFNFAVEGHIPFASGRAADGGGLGFAAHLPMHDDFDVPDLGYRQSAILNSAAPWDLRKGKRIVPSPSFESWKPRFFSSFDAAKESLKSQVKPDSDILQNLGIDRNKGSMNFLEAWQGSILGKIIQGLLVNFPRFLSIFQKLVIEPPAFLQGCLKRRLLFSGRVQAVFECCKH